LPSRATQWTWGANWYGQLDDGTGTDQWMPVRDGTDTTWACVAAGHLHTVEVKTNGTLWAWGADEYGQLGDGTTTNQWSPVRIGTDTRWVSAAAGYEHTLALRR
jgi:alpha-tubulin suppressor-like RCC1 family protein